jgi:ribosomal protein L37AE/L43A
MGKYENAKFLVKRKARKDWVCFKCGKKISVGQSYYR